MPFTIDFIYFSKPSLKCMSSFRLTLLLNTRGKIESSFKCYLLIFKYSILLLSLVPEKNYNIFIILQLRFILIQE